MAQKKNWRSDGTYIISQGSEANPKLGAKLLKIGNESLFLDYYLGYTRDEKTGKVKKIRKREMLNLYLLKNPRTPIERQQNKDNLELAKKIRAEREQQLKEQEKGYRLKADNTNINMLDYFQQYIDSYTKKDVRMMRLAFARFKDFLKDTKEYRRYRRDIKPRHMDKTMMEVFTDYLKHRSRGEGAHTLFARFKKFIKYAVTNGVLPANPCDGVKIQKDDSITKDILSQEEMRQLLATRYPGQSPRVRRAFTFCLLTGIRYCDVKALQYRDVDFANRVLKFKQSKTEGHSSHSEVIIPLNDTLLDLIGEPTDGNREALIFPLPTYEACLKSIGRWVNHAGINKHITWHCARHSAATAMLENGANVIVVKELLGHSSLKYTEVYLRAIDKQKRAAIDSLPNINI